MVGNITKSLVIGLGIVLLSGCGASSEPKPAAQSKAEAQKPEEKVCKVDNVRAPEWVCSGVDSSNTYQFSAVGKGTSKNPRMKKSQAMMRARAALAQKADKTKATLKDTQALTQWNAPNGDLYILVGANKIQ